MKKILFAAFLTLVTLPSWAADVDIDQQDIGSEEITDPAPSKKKATPFSFGAHADAISEAEITNTFYKKDKLTFVTAQVEGGMIVYYCPRFTEGLRVQAGFTPTYIKWTGNPWFEQDHFNLANLSLIGFSKRFERWFWRSQLTVNVDVDEWSSNYMSYDILLWGRYEYCKNVGIHLGFWAETGLQMDRVYPVIGFDWTISPKWKPNLVYPVNISLEYSLAKRWTLAVAGRFFNSRFRAGSDEGTAKALVRYSNVGTEFAIKYENDTMDANLHAGITYGGKFRVAKKHNNDPTTYKLDSSAYAGGEINVKF